MVAVLGVRRVALGAALALCASLAFAEAPGARTRTVRSADGVRIAYDVRGQGEPALVLVHGWSCDRTYWKEQAEALAPRFQVVTVDLAGHGASRRNRKDWTIAAFGADVAATVQALELRRVVLVGHSMGGDAVVEAARLLPGRVAGLVWVDTYKQLGTFRTPEQVEAMLSGFRRDFRGSTRALVRLMFPIGADAALMERVAKDMSAAPPAVAVPSLRAAITYDREVPEALRALGLPVVAINPERPASDLVSLTRHGVALERMPGVGHFPMLEAPEAFRARLEEVVGRLQPEAAP